MNFELTGTNTSGQSDSTLVHLAYFVGTGVDDLGPDSNGDDIVFQTVTLQSAGPIHEEDEDGNIDNISEGGETTDANGVVTYTFRMNHPGETVVTHPVSAVYEERDAANKFVFETTTLIDPNGALPTNHPPVAGIPTVGAPDPLTGAVSGTLGFTDPDGDPLTYAVTTTPTSGMVTVTAAGNYTYVPTAARQIRRSGQRHTAERHVRRDRQRRPGRCDGRVRHGPRRPGPAHRHQHRRGRLPGRDRRQSRRFPPLTSAAASGSNGVVTVINIRDPCPSSAPSAPPTIPSRSS